MCGIIAIASEKNIVNDLLCGLKRIEYRGYDSSGIAVLVNNKIQLKHAVGKIINLEQTLKKQPITSNIGIAHTRWATHGIPSIKNTHPISNSKLAIIHNGIIENYKQLKKQLEKQGYKFKSETDTEVIVHLITSFLKSNNSPKDSVFKTIKELKGSYSIAVIFANHPNLIIGAKQGSPLAIGYGNKEMLLGSDSLALAPFTTKISYLEDGDVVILSNKTAKIYDKNKIEVKRPIKSNNLFKMPILKGKFKHFMLKEIFEQPYVNKHLITCFLSAKQDKIIIPKLPIDIKKLKNITIVACGTAYYAGLVAKYWFEKLTKIPVNIDIASEFRYRSPPLINDQLAIFISQSGETADTIAALRYAKSKKQKCISITNVPESTIDRESHLTLYTQAGPEIGVASTKAFTNQLSILACLSINFAATLSNINQTEYKKFSYNLSLLPDLLLKVLDLENKIKTISKNIISHAKGVFFLGRNLNYPIALEGALKLKEISYIHAEGFAAGEIKHGPIALIDDNMPIVIIAPTCSVFDKMLSNAKEVAARGGHLIFISDENGQKQLEEDKVTRITLPNINELLSPILYTVPLQLLAYHTAAFKGTDIDQPRNLAKSVTVE